MSLEIDLDMSINNQEWKKKNIFLDRKTHFVRKARGQISFNPTSIEQFSIAEF